MTALWTLFNGSKTELGKSLIMIGVALGVLTPEDVAGLNAQVPVAVAGIGAVLNLFGIGHRIIKRRRGE